MRKSTNKALQKKTIKKEELPLLKPVKKTKKKPSVYLSYKKEPTIAEEAMPMSIVHWLGRSRAIPANIRSDFDFIKLGQAGISKAAIDKLAHFIGMSRKNMAEEIFDISIKTLERKDDHTKLDKRISSHALEIARVVQHAFIVFRDEEKLRLWLNRENKALNNMKPVQVFDTLTGLNMVNDILGRIEEGVFS